MNSLPSSRTRYPCRPESLAIGCEESAARRASRVFAQGRRRALLLFFFFSLTYFPSRALDWYLSLSLSFSFSILQFPFTCRRVVAGEKGIMRSRALNVQR